MQLLEESCQLAKEKQAVGTLESFTAFINDMLPLDVLQALEEVNGGDDYLADLWRERYEEQEEQDEGDTMEDGTCQICERQVRLTRHHVFPREVHRSLKKQGCEARDLSTTIAICRMCHSTVHRLFTNDQLAEAYYTVDLLLADERFFKYAKWAANLPAHRYMR